MDDDRLVSELERRARSASPRSGWASRDLLPAVRHEIDARPVKVMTSRWPSLAGVAALVAAILVLAVAVPRLAPQPPAASPPELEVLSAQTFDANRVNGTYEGQTVLVDGAIVAFDGPYSSPNCSPTNRCMPVIGQLEGGEPGPLISAPDVAVPNAEVSGLEKSDGWPWWMRVAPPIRGILMLFVNGGRIEFLGRVVPNGDGLTWSAGEVKTRLLTSARDLDEVVLVNGWLTGSEVGANCAPQPSAIPDLSLRVLCGWASWLTDEPVVINPLEQMIPPSALQVQADAFATYAPDPSARLGLALAPQRALYGVAGRLYGNGCIDPTQPCWDWSVVGRLSQPAPDVTPPSLPVVPTPQIEPSPSAARQLQCGTLSPVVIDETGLVEECTSFATEASQESPVVVQNQGGDQTVLEISWSAGPCDGPDKLTFKVAADGYELAALNTTPANIICDGVIREMHVVLKLSLLIPAETVPVTFERAPPTTPEPLATPQGALFDCPPTYGTDGVSSAHATIVDQTGLVTGCTRPDDTLIVWSEGHPMDIGNPNGDTTALQIAWGGVPCDAQREYVLRREGDGYVLEGRSTYPGEYCILPLVSHTIQLTLSAPIDATNVALSWIDLPPVPAPSPTPLSAIRTFACAGSGALAGSEITFIDHSGLIVGCSMTQRESAQSSIEDLEITSTATPNQLSVWWPVSVGCPADEQLELWGPVDRVVGLSEYVLQLARQRSPQFDPLDCGDVRDIRQVRVDLADTVEPEDVFPVAIDRWMADGTVSRVASSGAFDLRLAAPQVLVPDEPIDITSMLSYHGVDSVTLSGWWQPNFAFVSLTGGPSFESYGSILLCPEGEADMSPGDGISGHLQGPTELDPGDPNYAYREEYAYDGQFRLPAGAYLIYTGVTFNVGAECGGERVQLRNAIVIEVGLIGTGGILQGP